MQAMKSIQTKQAKEMAKASKAGKEKVRIGSDTGA